MYAFSLPKYLEAGEQVRLTNVGGAVVEDVRTVFERKNDATIYIPTFQPMTLV